MWDDLAHGVLQACINTMGIPVVYTTISGAEFSITGIFDASTKVITAKDGLEYSSIHPTLGIQLSDLPVTPCDMDYVNVNGIEYTIIDQNPDGHGGTQLILQR